MGKITFILGGARSGKSTYALELAKKHERVGFVATCVAKDKEMAQRIALHKKNRPKDWATFENPKDITLLLKKVGNDFDVVIIDCLTLLVSNFIFSGLKQEDTEKKIQGLVDVAKKIKARVVIVSNEVGLGIVPNTRLGRDFRDIAGRVNQMVAKNANQVFFVVAGIPWRIK